MRKRIVVLWISCAIACWGVDFQGKVLDAKGLPVSGATVIVAVSSIDGPVKAAITWTAQSAPDGTYKVPGLAAGPYVVCASPTTTSLLDSCSWEPTQQIVRLASGSPTVTTQLKTSALLSIRVDDAAGLLAAAASGGQTRVLVFGVQGPMGFNGASHISSDATGHNFVLPVPPAVPLKFVVSGQHLSVKDATGTPVSAAPAIPLNLTAGQTMLLHYSLSAAP